MTDLYLEPVEEEVEASEETSFSSPGFSEDDRNEILAEIDELVSENKIPITKELFRIKPRKTGVLMPVLINLMAIGIVAAVFFLFRGAYNSSQNAENESIINYYSGGAGEILERLRAESEAELAAKNAEIQDIQSRLSDLDKQKNELQGNIDSIVEQKKRELEQEMQAFLDDERARLQEEGNTDTEINAKLDAAQKEREDQYAQQLTEARSAAEEELRQKEAELENERKLLESQRQNAEQELTDIESSYQKELEERQAAFDEERAALTAEASEASSALEKLNAQRQQERTISNQIDGSFSKIIASMKTSEFETALTEIDNLEALYANPKITTLPAVAGRMQNDLFTLDTFRDQIEMKARVEEINTANLAQAANILVTTTEYAEQGLKEYKEGNTGDARTTLRQAVEKVPELYEAFAALQKIETVDKTDISKNHIKTGTSYYNQNALTKAVESFQEAAYVVAEDNKKELEEALKGMSRVYEKLNQEKLYAKNEEIKKLDNASAGKDSEIKKLQAKINEQQEAYSKLNEDYTALLEKKTAAASSSESTGQQNEALQASLDEARTQLATLQTSNDDLKAANAELSTSIEEARAALEKLQDENAQAAADLQDTESANLELDTALTANQEELNRVKGELETLTTRNSELENELVQAKAAFTGNQEDYDAAVSAVSEVQQEVTRLKEENAKLNEDLTTSENTIAALNLEIEDRKKTIDTLESSITSAEGEAGSAVQATAELNARHQQEIGELKTDLDEQTTRNAFLERQSSELGRQLKEMTNQKNEAFALVSRLRDEKAILETDLENAIDDSEKNLRQLKKDSEEAIAEKDRFIDSLISSYINYADKINSKLKENTNASINEAEHLLDSFLGNENINALFPNFSEMLTNLQQRSIEIERKAIEARSRDNTLNEVLVASRYFSGAGGANASYLTRINSLSGSDEKYREIVEAFESLALRGELTSGTTEQTMLLGSVVSVRSGELIIEPLINDPGRIGEGDIINIKRKDRYGRESDITQARITSVKAGRITASFIDSGSANRPLTADLVYKTETE